MHSDDDESPAQASEKSTTIQIPDRNLLNQSADFYTYYSSLPKDSRPRPDSFSYKELQTLFEKQKKQGVNNSHSTGYASKDQKLVGQEILKLCLEGFSEGIAETSLCIRSGYKTDNIGQFRRAFSKAADVPFGPLSRMIADLGKKKDENKERIRNYLNHQDHSNSTDKSISIEKEFDRAIAERRTVEIRSTLRVRNAGFRSAVLRNFLYKCACCGIDIPDLLEAAHIVPVANDGTDHPSNGIALCPTHHSAFDRHYFTFEPGSRKLILKEGITTNQLRITRELLEADVNDECLALRQRLFNVGIKD